MKQMWPIILVAAAAAVTVIRTAADELSREGAVQFSNGETLEGRLSMTRGKDLVLHTGPVVRNVPFTRVREIRLLPENEELVKKWRFLEAGQIKKETWGEPYPVRNFTAELALADDEVITGHLYTAVLYVETTNGTEKVILPAKQRGDEGATLAALVYPARIVFRDEAEKATANVRITLAFAPEQGGGDSLELCALMRGSLARLEARKTAAAGQYRMPSPLGAQIFAAVRQGEVIYAGWPAARDAKLFKLVQDTLPTVRDFFDQQELLGVFRDPADGSVYSLLMLARKGQTTLAAARSQPWRCEVWRWRYDEAGGRVLMAGRGYFFRGIIGKDEVPPRVQIAEQLWQVRTDGDRIVIGEAQP